MDSKKEKITKVKIDDVIVEMQYSKDNKSLSECMINIFKQMLGE